MPWAEHREGQILRNWAEQKMFQMSCKLHQNAFSGIEVLLYNMEAGCGEDQSLRMLGLLLERKSFYWGWKINLWTLFLLLWFTAIFAFNDITEFLKLVWPCRLPTYPYLYAEIRDLGIFLAFTYMRVVTRIYTFAKCRLRTWWGGIFWGKTPVSAPGKAPHCTMTHSTPVPIGPPHHVVICLYACTGDRRPHRMPQIQGAG